MYRLDVIETQAYLDLVDWRSRVGDLYRLGGEGAVRAFRAGRDALFASHPQSPIPEADRAEFMGLPYFDADPAFRFRTRIEPVDDNSEIVIATAGPDGDIRYRRAGRLRFDLGGQKCSLTVFWLIGYGGGLFLPFRDATSGKRTYGGGRYLFDTIKSTYGLALEVAAGSPEVTIDFNYAYNPSCAYDPHWACPLAPRENWLEVPVTAGEKVYGHD
jgi:uncharacterized protein (DUF1684 family)